MDRGSVKIDLHRHLEGSHSAEALLEVAGALSLRHPLFYDAAAARYRSPAELRGALTVDGPSDDAQRFYKCIQQARVAYVSVAAIRELARRAFLEAAADADAFEMRVSLFSMTRTLVENSGGAWRALPPARFAALAEQVLEGVLAARDAAQEAAKKQMLVRLAFSRTFESEPHYRALGEMAQGHSRALCGLDVLGIVTGPDASADREPLPPALLEILSALRRSVPDLTIHAGEFESHASVERTLALEPQGIGHGVHAVESDAVMARLGREGVTLEVCPTSNALLIPSALARLTALRQRAPLAALQHAHVHCVLGSDDPTPFGTSFSREWAQAQALGADLAQLEADTLRRWRQLA